MPANAQELERLYSARFDSTKDYRNQVWQVLTRAHFSKWTGQGTVFDLGCGYGEFINNIKARQKYAMDLNPRAREFLLSDVEFFQQDCTEAWPVAENSLDLVFTSNFFEHLPQKSLLNRILQQAWRCLKPGAHIVCMGPNIKYLPGKYWDFWDHFLPLTELSLKEVLEHERFQVRECIAKFLPYTMVGGPRYPMAFLQLYLKIPLAWKILGRQFLLVAQKPVASE